MKGKVVKKKVMTEEIIKLLKKGKKILDYEILGLLDLSELSKNGIINKEIKFENCIIEKLKIVMVETLELIEIDNCIIKKLDINATFFKKGLKIINSSFECPVYFLNSGYNEQKTSIIINKNIFNKYVDFQDFRCPYNFELMGNDFKIGTNIELMERLRIDIGADSLISNNSGKLNLDLKY